VFLGYVALWFTGKTGMAYKWLLKGDQILRIMKKRPAPSRKTRKKRPVKTLIEPRRSGVLILVIWTAIAMFA